MKKTDVTIAIVNYKTRDLLRLCIESIYRYTKGVSFEIVVVDNNSRDGSVEMMRKEFPKIKLIVNKRNNFATRGNNQILKEAYGRYSLVLNPDIVFFDDAVSKMVEFLDKNKQVGGVSCLQQMADGKVDKTCSRFSTPTIEFFESSMFGKFFKNRKLLSWYRYRGWNRKSVREVEVVPDTIMLSRTDVLASVGYYDENIDLFFMENDLCLRMKEVGFSVWHLGNVAVVHLRGQSTKQFKPKEMYEFYEHDMLYYYRKHFGILWSSFLYIAFLGNRIYYLFEGAFSYLRERKLIV